MHRAAAYGSVFVCVSVGTCITAITVHQLKRSATKRLYRLLVTFSWIYIRGFGK